MTHITGIIGGMGPQASLRLYQIIIEKASSQYGATDNQDFPHFILNNVPVPDTISNDAMKGRLIEMLIKETVRLKEAGCDTIVMACNTAHLFESHLHEAAQGSFVSLIDIVVNEAEKQGHEKLAVIGSPMTIKSELYSGRMESHGIETINKYDPDIDVYEGIIRNHIAGRTSDEEALSLEKMCMKFIDSGAEKVVLGCTELSSILRNSPVMAHCIDPLEILANVVCDHSLVRMQLEK